MRNPVRLAEQLVRLRSMWFCGAERADGPCSSFRCLAVFAIICGACSAAWAQGGGADTSRAAQMDAVRTIPFDRLNEAAKTKISRVVSRPSLFRRLPVETVECDPEMYVFLVRHPEVIVGMWNSFGITSVSLDRVGPYVLRGSDGSGTSANAEIIYGDQDTHVLYGEGLYEGKMLRRPVTGRCVIVLQSGYARNTAGGTNVTSRLDIFLQVDNAGVEMAARTLQPLVGRTADHNFSESAKFVSRVSKWAADETEQLTALAGRLEGVTPEVRQKFTEVIASVNERAGGSAVQNTGAIRP